MSVVIIKYLCRITNSTGWGQYYCSKYTVTHFSVSHCMRYKSKLFRGLNKSHCFFMLKERGTSQNRNRACLPSIPPTFCKIFSRSQFTYSGQKTKKDWCSLLLYLVPSPCGLRFVSLPLSIKFFHHIIIGALQPNCYLVHRYCFHIIWLYPSFKSVLDIFGTNWSHENTDKYLILYSSSTTGCVILGKWFNVSVSVLSSVKWR